MSSAKHSNQSVPSKCPRVAFLMPVGGSGGVQRVMTNLANGLCQQGYSPDIWCCDARKDLPGLDEALSVTDLRMRSLRGDYKVLAAARTIRRLIRQRKPDVLLTAPGFSGQVGIFAARGLPTRVVAMVDNRLSTLRMSSLKHRVFYQSARLAYGHADCVVAAHDAALEDLRKVLPTGATAQLTRIYHPIVPDSIDDLMRETVQIPCPTDVPSIAATGRPVQKDDVDDLMREAAQAPGPSDVSTVVAAERPVQGDNLDDLMRETVQTPGPSDVPTIVAAGRLVQEKDFSSLLQAFAIVRNKRRCRLVILGDGPLRDELQLQAKTLGIEQNVLFAGMVPNVYAYFARSDLFVLSSEREAFGNVLVEALAVGLSCVATRCESGGPQEILAEGTYGLLVPRRDCAALADAMERALDRRPASVDETRKRGRQFSVSESARQYAQLFVELAR